MNNKIYSLIICICITVFMMSVTIKIATSLRDLNDKQQTDTVINEEPSYVCTSTNTMVQKVRYGIYNITLPNGRVIRTNTFGMPHFYDHDPCLIAQAKLHGRYTVEGYSPRGTGYFATKHMLHGGMPSTGFKTGF